jgi:hypothetical protein
MKSASSGIPSAAWSLILASSFLTAGVAWAQTSAAPTDTAPVTASSAAPTTPAAGSPASVAPAAPVSPGAPGHHGHHGHHGSRDAHQAQHSRVAAERFQERRFKALDTDGDGMVSRTEFEAEHERMRAQRLAAFDAADTDKDGRLTPKEMAAFHQAVRQAMRESMRAMPK